MDIVYRVKWKKVFTLLCVILSFISVAAGCVAKNKVGKSSGEIIVFAAASLSESFQEAGKIFEEKNNIKVTFNFAGSQDLAASLKEGAEADVFASANMQYMMELEKEKFVSKSQIFAGNILIICRNKKSEKKITELSHLAEKDLKIIAADKSVPAGQYFHTALQNAVKSNAIPAEVQTNILNNIISNELNVKNVVNKVALGEADVGIVYKTDVNEKNREQLEAVTVKEFENTKVQYPIATIMTSKQQKQGEAFIAFLMSGEGKQILKKHGFLLD